MMALLVLPCFLGSPVVHTALCIPKPILEHQQFLPLTVKASTYLFPSPLTSCVTMASFSPSLSLGFFAYEMQTVFAVAHIVCMRRTGDEEQTMMGLAGTWFLLF